MPLTLTDASLERPKLITYDPRIVSECRDAEKKLKEFCSEGYKIGKWIGGEIHLDPPPRDPDTVLVRVIDETGDSRLVWNRKILDEIKEARQKFDEYLEKGYRAYVCRLDGSKGSRVDSFDALMEEVVLEKGEAMLLPKTAPG